MSAADDFETLEREVARLRRMRCAAELELRLAPRDTPPPPAPADTDGWVPAYDLDELAVEIAVADSARRAAVGRRGAELERRRRRRELVLALALAVVMLAALYAATAGGPLGSFAGAP